MAWTKEQHAEYNREWRKRNRAKINAYQNQWRAENRDKVRASHQRWREGHPGYDRAWGAGAKTRAWASVQRAVRSGKLVRPEVCELCLTNPPPASDGRSRIQAHHENYDAPLDVQWLCEPCHVKARKR